MSTHLASTHLDSTHLVSTHLAMILDGSMHGRHISPADDPAKVTLLAKRVQAALAQAINPEPIQIRPQRVKPSLVQRQFSVQQVHNMILRSFIQDGHDPTRPKVGVCCEIRDRKKLQELIDHSKKMADRSPLMPLVEADMVQFEALSCAHYNSALDLVRLGRTSPAGDLAKARDTDNTLRAAAMEGHFWTVLLADVAEDLKRDICTWFNQGQNEDQQLTDGEMMRMALTATEQFLTNKVSTAPGKSSVIPLHSVTLSATLQSPLKIRMEHMNGFARWVLRMAEENNLHLVHEFLDYWSCNVDPKALVISHSFFETVGKCEFLKGAEYGLLRLHLAQANYTNEGSQARSPTQPAICNMIGNNELNIFEKQKHTLHLVRDTLKTLHECYRPLLLKELKLDEVNDLAYTCGALVVRLAFSKKLSFESTSEWPRCPITTGKCTQEKINGLLGWWGKNAEKKYPHLKEFGKQSLLAEHYPKEKEVVKAVETFELPAAPAPGTGAESGTDSESATDAAPGTGGKPAATPTPGKVAPIAPGTGTPKSVIVGEKLFVMTRMTLKLKGEHRKDIRKGAVVEVLKIPERSDKEHPTPEPLRLLALPPIGSLNEL